MNLKLKWQKKKPHYHFETWGFKLRLFILYPYSRVKGRMHIVDFRVKLIVAEISEKSRNTEHVEQLKAQGWKLKAKAPEVPRFLGRLGRLEKA